jgi:hypothetical protein
VADQSERQVQRQGKVASRRMTEFIHYRNLTSRTLRVLWDGLFESTLRLLPFPLLVVRHAQKRVSLGELLVPLEGTLQMRNAAIQIMIFDGLLALVVFLAGRLGHGEIEGLHRATIRILVRHGRRLVCVSRPGMPCRSGNSRDPLFEWLAGSQRT